MSRSEACSTNIVSIGNAFKWDEANLTAEILTGKCGSRGKMASQPRLITN
jgi:hypothetical protein